MDLNTIWFLLVGVLIIGYAILDGFDLGVGILYPFLSKSESDKKALINSVGPFWDGNEVWLLTGGGALFAAFPVVYATVFSGFYLAMILVVLGLIMRAVSLEYRSQADQGWHGKMDMLFFAGSLIPALLFGVAIGNIAKGLPLDAGYHYTGGFWALLNPYALLTGLLGLAAIIMHGSVYTILKQDGSLKAGSQRLFPKVWLVFVILYIVAAVYTYLVASELFSNYENYPVLYLVPILTAAGIASLPQLVKRGKEGLAFLASSVVFGSMILTLAMGMFPNLVPALNPDLSLTIYNAASSPLTLKTMLIIALTGIPIVLFYTVYVYRVFGGKVSSDQEGY